MNGKKILSIVLVNRILIRGALSWIQLYLCLIFKRILSVTQARMSVAKHQIEPMLEKVNTIIDQFNSRWNSSCVYRE